MRRDRQWRGERGGLTLEHLGVMVVVIALVAGVVVTVPEAGSAFGEKVAAMICRVAGLGCDLGAAGDPGDGDPDGEDGGGDGDGDGGDGDGGGDDDGDDGGGGFLDDVGGFLGDVGGGVTNFLGGAGDLLGNVAGGVGDFFGGVGDFFGGLLSPLRDAWDSAWQLVTNPLEWLDERWDNLYNHIAFWNWDTFADTWKQFGKDFLAWDEWGRNWPRALGILTFNVGTLGVGSLVKRFLTRGGRRGGGDTEQGDTGNGQDQGNGGNQGNGNDGNGNGNDQGDGNEGDQGPTPEQNRQQFPPPQGAPGYDRIRRGAETRVDSNGEAVRSDSDTHILGGEGYGRGGHRPGTGYPNKTEFPDGWTDGQILDAVDQATQNPVTAWQAGNSPGRWTYVGEARRPDGGNLRVNIVVDRNGRVVSAFPEPNQPGVFRNPPRPQSAPQGAANNRPVYTRPDPQTGADGYWTYDGPNGTQIHTDQNGQVVQPGGN